MISAQRRDAESRDFVGHESAMGSAESRRILRLRLVGERIHEPHVARVAMEPLDGGPPAPVSHGCNESRLNAGWELHQRAVLQRAATERPMGPSRRSFLRLDVNCKRGDRSSR